MVKTKDETVKIDGNEYKKEELSENAVTQLANLQFVDLRLQQLQNELAVSDTARIAYTRALKNQLVSSDAE